MNIHDAIKDDDVAGQIIGDIMSIGYLTYEGRKQRGQIYAKNENELKEKAKSLKQEIRKEFGSSFNDIYPKEEWRLNIIQ